MTILIGFTAHDAVVLASDSQTTIGGSKDMESQKVIAVPLPDGGSIALAKCGVMNTATYFQEHLEILLSTASLNHPRAIADAAENAMKITHGRLLGELRQEGASSEEIRQRIYDHDCECLIGYVHDAKPYLYSITLSSHLAIRITAPFYVTGSGENMARSVLSGFDLAKMHSIESLAVAAYAVEISKKFDQFCSGRTQIGIVLAKLNSCHTDIASKEVMEKYVRLCEETYLELKITLANTLGYKAEQSIPHAEA